MSRAALVCALSAVLCSYWLENVDAQLSSEQDSGSIVQSIETLSKVVQNLQIEIKMQSSVLSNLVSKEELESILFNNLVTKSDMQMQKIALQNLEAKAGMHENSLSNLQATVDELKTLLINSSVKGDEQVASLSNLKEANRLTDEDANVTTTCAVVGRLADIQNFSSTKGIVEGIIVGTRESVVIIPLNTRDQRTISSNDTYLTGGVAFNWQSRKVYWTEYKGIKSADLDGRHAELLVSDESPLIGLAVDQITGNFYYGSGEPNPRIRVCDSMGKKCVTVASGADIVGNDIWDIALFPSQGLMFWSNSYHNEKVTRANMDGTNATVIISEQIFGLYLDESTEKLYWANEDGSSIGNYDLNSNSFNVLLNTTNQPADIAVDGDTLYFGGNHPNGVYSVTSNGKFCPISNITEEINHITFYGRNKTFHRSNPCENSTCANLCVLTRLSYTCL